MRVKSLTYLLNCLLTLLFTPKLRRCVATCSFDDGEFSSERPATSLADDIRRPLSVQRVGLWSDNSLEAVLRRRIADLEQVEDHLRRQVLEHALQLFVNLYCRLQIGSLRTYLL